MRPQLRRGEQHELAMLNPIQHSPGIPFGYDSTLAIYNFNTATRLNKRPPPIRPALNKAFNNLTLVSTFHEFKIKTPFNSAHAFTNLNT